MRRLASRSRRAGALGAFALLVLVTRCDLAVSLKNLDGGCLPGQIRITTVPPGSSPFCIDATETTNAQYQQFLNSKFSMGEAAIPGGVCDGEDGGVPTDVVPTGWPPASGSDDFPVVNVNWCQAYTFCKWAGKRLCGQIGGGPLLAQSFSDPTQSQWLNACSQGGALTYPYGNTWNGPLCGGQQVTNSSTEPVTYITSASGAPCVGPEPGLYYMSGNVWEWTDTCNNPIPSQTDATAFCEAMGGAFNSTEMELECVGERPWVRGGGATDIGLRCCLDL